MQCGLAPMDANAEGAQQSEAEARKGKGHLAMNVKANRRRRSLRCFRQFELPGRMLSRKQPGSASEN